MIRHSARRRESQRVFAGRVLIRPLSSILNGTIDRPCPKLGGAFRSGIVAARHAVWHEWVMPPARSLSANSSMTLRKAYAVPRERTIADVGTLCAAWPTKGFWNCDTSHRGLRDPPACGLLRFRNA